MFLLHVFLPELHVCTVGVYVFFFRIERDDFLVTIYHFRGEMQELSLYVYHKVEQNIQKQLLLFTA
jgi:ABC-type spermidine/putrescine transport system permease subunit II